MRGHRKNEPTRYHGTMGGDSSCEKKFLKGDAVARAEEGARK